MTGRSRRMTRAEALAIYDAAIHRKATMTRLRVRALHGTGLYATRLPFDVGWLIGQRHAPRVEFFLAHPQAKEIP